MSDTVTLKLYLHAEQTKAIMVHESPLYHTANKAETWLPRSQVEIIETANSGPPLGRTLLTIRIPRWLAVRKGLAKEG